MMNTKQMSELYTLHSMVNDPMTYEEADAPKDPLAWLFNALAKVVSKRRRDERVRFSEMDVAAGRAN